MNELSGLRPVMATRAKQFLELARKEAKVVVTATYRASNIQKALWMQGRYPLDRINSYRQYIGLPPISQKENVKITNAQAGYSFHNYGLAFDCLFFKDDKLITSSKDTFWKKVKQWAQECDLKWGGDFKNLFDAGHFQYPHITIQELLQGKMPE